MRIAVFSMLFAGCQERRSPSSVSFGLQIRNASGLDLVHVQLFDGEQQFSPGILMNGVSTSFVGENTPLTGQKMRITGKYYVVDALGEHQVGDPIEAIVVDAVNRPYSGQVVVITINAELMAEVEVRQEFRID
jgi:hypothetical protein